MTKIAATLTGNRIHVYNPNDNLRPCQERKKRRPGTSLAPITVAQGTSEDSPDDRAARLNADALSCSREAARAIRRNLRVQASGDRRERIEEARFIASEAGARFVYDPSDPDGDDPDGLHVDGAGWIDEKTREAAVTIAKDGSYGRVDFPTAQRESEEYARQLARKPDIDPDGPDFDGCSAFRMSLLQGLVRYFGSQSENPKNSND